MLSFGRSIALYLKDSSKMSDVMSSWSFFSRADISIDCWLDSNTDLTGLVSAEADLAADDVAEDDWVEGSSWVMNAFVFNAA